MSDTLEVITSDSAIPLNDVEEHRKAAPSRLWQRLGLGAVMLISIFMNFFQLGQNGFANLYYASAIRSMLDNWHTLSKCSYSPAQLDGFLMDRRRGVA